MLGFQDPSHMNINPQFPEHEHLNCPRCDSSNTKFCYYNNYNLSQPRHYCKNCRRYWTKGGSLRNIPIGGGIRKTTKRSSISNKRNPPTSPTPTPPPTQLKPEPSGILSFGDDQNQISGLDLNSMLRSNQFGNFVQGWSTNGSHEDGSPATDVLLRNYLSVNNDHNQTTGIGESGGFDGGRNEWPTTNLSIFTSGSNFH